MKQKEEKSRSRIRTKCSNSFRTRKKKGNCSRCSSYLTESEGRIESQLAIVEANLKNAVTNGDGDAAVEAQKVLAQLVYQKEKLENDKKQKLQRNNKYNNLSHNNNLNNKELILRHESGLKIMNGLVRIER